MRAYTINENINFKRGMGAKKTLGLGSVRHLVKEIKLPLIAHEPEHPGRSWLIASPATGPELHQGGETYIEINTQIDMSQEALKELANLVTGFLNNFLAKK